MKAISDGGKVLFFLGAGASVPAGVPTTQKFLYDFKEDLTHRGKNSELETLEAIIDRLSRWSELKEEPYYGSIDIELLLETLEALETKSKNILMNFFENGNFILDGYMEKAPIIEELKFFIRKTCMVREEDTKYLRPILKYLEPISERNVIDIFSTNYDTSIEQFCSANYKRYVDGFELYWNPTIFQSENCDFRLYKIHGSILWYTTNKQNYVKIPLKISRFNDGNHGNLLQDYTLFNDEIASPALLYPMRKLDYGGPYLFIIQELKRKLLSVNWVVVVGYSFRDPMIKRIFLEAAKENKEMLLILISPSAKKIYKKMLYNYDDGKETELKHRVLCLGYPFQTIFPVLHSGYITKIPEFYDYISKYGIEPGHSNQYHEQRIFKLINADCVEMLYDRMGIEKPTDLVTIMKDYLIDFTHQLRILLDLYLYHLINDWDESKIMKNTILAFFYMLIQEIKGQYNINIDHIDSRDFSLKMKNIEIAIFNSIIQGHVDNLKYKLRQLILPQSIVFDSDIETIEDNDADRIKLMKENLIFFKELVNLFKDLHTNRREVKTYYSVDSTKDSIDSVKSELTGAFDNRLIDLIIEYFKKIYPYCQGEEDNVDIENLNSIVLFLEHTLNGDESK